MKGSQVCRVWYQVLTVSSGTAHLSGCTGPIQGHQTTLRGRYVRLGVSFFRKKPNMNFVFPSGFPFNNTRAYPSPQKEDPPRPRGVQGMARNITERVPSASKKEAAEAPSLQGAGPAVRLQAGGDFDDQRGSGQVQVALQEGHPRGGSKDTSPWVPVVNVFFCC